MAQEITQEEFSKILPLICTAETSVDPNSWTPENPLWGHCAIVSAIGEDLFGGDMLRACLDGNPGFSKNDSHYWNCLSNGVKIDFTKEQFGKNYPVLVDPVVRTREYVLFGPADAKPEIKQRFENTRRRFKILSWRLAKTFYPQNQLFDDPMYQKCFFAALDSQCQKMRFGCVITHNGEIVYEGCNSPLEPLRSFCEPKCIRFSITSRTESMIGACGHAEEGMWEVVKKGIPLEECELYIAGFYPNYLPWLKTKAEHTCLRCAVQMYYANMKTIYVPVREVKMNHSDVEIWERTSWRGMTAKQALETAREYTVRNIHLSSEHRKRLPVSVSVAVFIENEEGKLLMVRQAGDDADRGKWGFPAGGMDAHEDPMQAAIREAKEETGFDVELVDLIRIYTLDRGDDASGVAFAFRGHIVGGEMKLPPDEISDCRYFSPDEIMSMLQRGEIYKPEYNTANLQNWQNGYSYPLDVIQSLRAQ